MSKKYRLGIDVSHHQNPETLDYSKLKEEGYEWVMVRAAYGKRKDKKFVAHCEKARAAGLLVGAYIFYRQTQSVEAQFDAFVSQLDMVDWQIMPVVDLEWNEAYDGKVSRNKFNRDARELMAKLAEEFGSTVTAYIAPGFFQTLGNPDWVKEYPWWVAHFTQADKPWCPFKNWDMWQYSDKGNLAAYSGDLDVNRAVKLNIREDLIPIEENCPTYDQEIKLEGEWYATSVRFDEEGHATTTLMKRKL